MNLSKKDNAMFWSEKHGYDEEFVDTPADYLKCLVCQYVLKDPVVIVDCGHHYCSDCFNSIKGYSVHFSSQLCCPIDRGVVDLSRVFKDVCIARAVDDLKVKCSFHGNGCDWVGELRDLHVHRNACALRPATLRNKSVKDCCESDVFFQGLLQRVDRCEDGLNSTEKDMAHLKFQLNDVKEQLNVKDKLILELREKLEKLEQQQQQQQEQEQLQRQYQLQQPQQHKEEEQIIGKKDNEASLFVTFKVFEDQMNSLNMMIKTIENRLGEELHRAPNDIESGEDKTTKSKVALELDFGISSEKIAAHCKEYFDVKLQRESGGLGFVISGGTDNPCSQDDSSIYITKIIQGGAAHHDGRMKVGDAIVSVNGVDIASVEQGVAAHILQSAGGEVVLKVLRIIDERAPCESKEAADSGTTSNMVNMVNVANMVNDQLHPEGKALLPFRDGEIDIIIHKGSSGLGFAIVGGTDSRHVKDDDGIFVSQVLLNSSAHEQLQIEDKILEVNGISFCHLTHKKAVHILKSTGKKVNLKILRNHCERM